MSDGKLTEKQAFARWQELSSRCEEADLALSEARVKMLKAKKAFELAEQRHQHTDETYHRISRESMEAYSVWRDIRNQENAAS